MKNHSSWIIVPLLVAVTMVGLTTARVQDASERHRQEAARLANLSRDVAAIKRLRSADVRAQATEPQEADLLRAVRRAIRSAGLPENTFSRLSTSGEQAVRGRDGYHRTPYQLELTVVDASDLGSFLGVWRTDHPLWTVESIELRRQQATRRSRGQITSDTGYAVSITMSTVFASDLGDDGGTAG